MKVKTNMPKISEKAATLEIADAARKAYRNSEVDSFFEEVMESARHYGKVFAEADQQTQTE